MTEPLKARLDLTVNLPVIIAIIGAVIAGTMWVSSVNNKLDTVAKIVADQTSNSARLSTLEADIAVIKANSTRNRELLEKR